MSGVYEKTNNVLYAADISTINPDFEILIFMMLCGTSTLDWGSV